LNQTRRGSGRSSDERSFLVMIHSREAWIEDLDTSSHFRDLRVTSTIILCTAPSSADGCTQKRTCSYFVVFQQDLLLLADFMFFFIVKDLAFSARIIVRCDMPQSDEARPLYDNPCIASIQSSSQTV
jgi:hypothetical protein